MFNDLLSGSGLLDMPWWSYVAITLVSTHITIACVTLFLHRSQAHRSVEFHPAVAHLMRFWLWLSTGMVTREWVAVHRKHHATVDTDEDPHSPVTHGILRVLLKGAELYQVEARRESTRKIYGQGTPQDWMERKVYTPFSTGGILLLLFVSYLLFGFWGVSMWAIQMMWIPFLAAGVVNGGGHFFGYRNYETSDSSTNLMNVGLLIGGEELHNNHHAFPGSAKMSVKKWEFDIGWFYINVLKSLNLAKVRMRSLPSRKVGLEAFCPEAEAVMRQTLVHECLHVMTEYVRTVMRPVFMNEVRRAKDLGYQRLLRKIREPFFHYRESAGCHEHKDLRSALENNMSLKTVYEFRHHLQSLWQDVRSDREKIRKELLRWCSNAENSGLHLLEDFARKIKGHTEAGQLLRSIPQT